MSNFNHWTTSFLIFVGTILVGQANAQTNTLGPVGRGEFNRLLAPAVPSPTQRELPKPRNDLLFKIERPQSTDQTKAREFDLVPFGTQTLQRLNPGGILESGTSAAPTTPPTTKAVDCLSPKTFRRVPMHGRGLPCTPVSILTRYAMWNQIALDTTAVDHTPAQPTPKTADGFESFQQIGPHRSSRAMAIVHIAIFDAVNEIVRRPANSVGEGIKYYRSYANKTPGSFPSASIESAIAHAAYQTLIYLYPRQAVELKALLDADFPKVKGTPEEKAAGQTIGETAARAIIDARSSDNSDHKEPVIGDPGFAIDNTAGKWRPDPVSNIRTALGGLWGRVKPFTFADQDRFRPPSPPDLDDAVYARDFAEVKSIGGHEQSTQRTKSEEFAGIFWAYDGTAFLCAPPRLYNQIVRTIVFEDYGETIKRANGDQSVEARAVLNVARIFALANTAMADAAISAWEAKWHYRFWRPITGIRAAGSDRNQRTIPDAEWQPLGAPASNSARGPNFTPPFPAYPSGHAVFGGALFETLRKFYNPETPFVFVSDEYNGYNAEMGADVTIIDDPDDPNDPPAKIVVPVKPRPLLPRSFATLRDAEKENGRSRVYIGVHWQFDSDAGIPQGNQIASHVFDNAFQCLNKDDLNIDCNAKTGLAPDQLPK